MIILEFLSFSNSILINWIKLHKQESGRYWITINLPLTYSTVATAVSSIEWWNAFVSIYITTSKINVQITDYGNNNTQTTLHCLAIGY